MFHRMEHSMSGRESFSYFIAIIWKHRTKSSLCLSGRLRGHHTCQLVCTGFHLKSLNSVLLLTNGFQSQNNCDDGGVSFWPHSQNVYKSWISRCQVIWFAPVASMRSTVPVVSEKERNPAYKSYAHKGWRDQDKSLLPTTEILLFSLQFFFIITGRKFHIKDSVSFKDAQKSAAVQRLELSHIYSHRCTLSYLWTHLGSKLRSFEVSAAHKPLQN